MTSTERPLRKDAERNRHRILDAARELFADRGLGVTLNDVAHHAGVGVGTVYRRYPNKTDLIEELFQSRMREMLSIMTAAVADPDPWRGFSGFLEQFMDLQSQDRGLADIMTSTPDGARKVEGFRAQMVPLATSLIERARDAGKLRADFDVSDLPILSLMLYHALDVTRDVEPQLWRRFLAIVLQGLRADEHLEPLDVAPLGTDRINDVMGGWKPARR